MRISLLVAAFAGACLLAGCQSTPQKNPYEYQYAKSDDQDLCLLTEPEGEVGLSLLVRNALEQKGFEVRYVTNFEDAGCRQCVKFTAQMGDLVSRRVKTATLEYVRPGCGDRHVVTSNDADEMRIFGTPTDDETIMVWSLVDRLFPDPMPWRDE